MPKKKLAQIIFIAKERSVDLITLIAVIVIVGVIMWLVNAYIPMPPMIKTVLNVAVVIFLVLWLLSLFVGGLPNIRVG